MTHDIAIVGNGPLNAGAAAQIDGAELVIRFNVPRHTPAEAGSRTDIMFIRNDGNALPKWFKQNAFQSSEYFRNTSRIILPRHPDNLNQPPLSKRIRNTLRRKKQHYTNRGILELSRLGKEVSVLPRHLERECYKDLGIERNSSPRLIPSTGFLGIKYALTLADDARIKLYGFTWQGWNGHPWQAEYEWLSECDRVTVSKRQMTSAS